MYVSQAYGITSTPSFQGGNNYAQGDARVNSPTPVVRPGFTIYSVAEQVSQLIQHARQDRERGLYVVFPFLAGTRPSEQLGLLWEGVEKSGKVSKNWCGTMIPR